jgi:hypothetical protein
MSSIYTILENLNKVTVKQETQENKKSQPIYESVEARGSIVAGVKDVEQRLREQFAAMKEASYVHKGTYGTEYQGDPDDEAAPKRGRPAKGTAKKEKVVQVKGPKGRPKKDPAASAPAKIGNDPFGRVPDKAPKGAKGTVIKGKATQDTNEDQINELSPELLKRASDAAGMKYAHADDRRDQKASEKYSAQNDKFNSAMRKKQKQNNVVRYYEKTQDIKKLTNWLEKEAGLPKNSPLYFDDIDLVYGNKTIVPGALVNPKLTFNDLLTAVVQASKQGMNEADGNTEASDKKKCPPMSHIKKMCKDGMSMAEICKMHPDCDRAELKQMVTDCKKQLEEAENPFASFKKQAKGTGLLRSKIKTKTKTMESSQRMAKLLIEGVNFTEMIKKKDMTLQEMLAELQQDIQSFKETGHCSELLRDCMEVHSYGKSQLNDATENPMDNDNFPTPLAPAQAPSMMDRAKRMGGQVLNTLGHGSDEDMKADLRRKMGMQEAAELNELARLAGLTVAESNDGNLANNAKPYKKVTRRDVIQGAQGKDEQGGEAEVDEAANWRNPEYKDRLYTQEPRDPEDDYHDLDYYTGEKPDDYAGSKDLIGGGEFDHNDPLQKGFGRHGHDVLDRGPRKGMPSRNHITSLKGSIKAAHGTHSQPNLPEGDMEEGAEAEASGFYVNYEIRTGDPERVAGPFAGQQEAQAWINDNVPNPSDEPYYNISQVGFNEDDMEEGNLFTKGLEDNDVKVGEKIPGTDAIKTKDIGEGETCPTCKSEPCCCEDTEAADRELAKLKENCGIVSPIGSMAQDMQQQQGKMSINTTQSSDGTKNINISADGEAADQLMQMLKMAGMGGQHAEVVVTAQPMEAKQYGNTEVTEPEEVLNTPRPDVRGMHRAETVGYADTTDDLNKQKDQDPETANRAANPKTAKVNRVAESHPLEALGAKLMAEYQSIKLTK